LSNPAVQAEPCKDDVVSSAEATAREPSSHDVSRPRQDNRHGLVVDRPKNAVGTQRQRTRACAVRRSASTLVSRSISHSRQMRTKKNGSPPVLPKPTNRRRLTGISVRLGDGALSKERPLGLGAGPVATAPLPLGRYEKQWRIGVRSAESRRGPRDRSMYWLRTVSCTGPGGDGLAE
jgi:hypothetical protein